MGGGVGRLKMVGWVGMGEKLGRLFIGGIECWRLGMGFLCLEH